jgi:hypothetical protein
MRRTRAGVRQRVPSMNARALLLVTFTLLSGCAARYKPPTLAEPHALVKLRRSYQSVAGSHLAERVTIDDHSAFVATDASRAALSPRTDVVLVHPKAAELHVESGFFHFERRLVTEPYSVQIPYTTSESYSCGSGSSYRTCSRTVTRYHTETRFRTVLKTIQIGDGSCGVNIWIAPRVGGSYVLEYDYADDRVCHLACFEQLQSSEVGTFENRQCSQPSQEEIRKALEER